MKRSNGSQSPEVWMAFAMWLCKTDVAEVEGIVKMGLIFKKLLKALSN
jgi:hypothetical protein